MINRSHVWFAAFVVIIFAAGLAAGIAIDRTLLPRGYGFRGPERGGRGPGVQGVRGPDGPGSRGPGGPGGPRRVGGPDGPPTEAFVRDLNEVLTLNADQQAKITAIVDARRPKLRALQDEVSKKFSDEQAALRAEIAKVLTPEQQKKFDELEKDRRFGGFGRGRGPR
jgi:hypothetical protein